MSRWPRRFGLWPRNRRADEPRKGGATVPPGEEPEEPGETFYVISARDGAIAVANNGDMATHD